MLVQQIVAHVALGLTQRERVFTYRRKILPLPRTLVSVETNLPEVVSLCERKTVTNLDDRCGGNSRAYNLSNPNTAAVAAAPTKAPYPSGKATAAAA